VKRDPFGPNSCKHPIDAELDGCGDRYVDWRVDDHKQPIVELRRLWELWKEWWASGENDRVEK
jgi:uncharacterized Ntn-hydrolase superfamily protein